MRLALIYNQDFGLLGIDPDSAAQSFLDQCSRSERQQLVQEIEDLLVLYPGRDQKGLKNAWKRLGAEWCDAELDLRSRLRKWISFAK